MNSIAKGSTPATRVKDTKGLGGWLNCKDFASGFIGLLGDACHGMAKTALHNFIRTFGVDAALLWLVEGVANVVSRIVKPYNKFHGGKSSHPRRWKVAGSAYSAFVIALFAFARGPPYRSIAGLVIK